MGRVGILDVWSVEKLVERHVPRSLGLELQEKGGTLRVLQSRRPSVQLLG